MRIDKVTRSTHTLAILAWSDRWRWRWEGHRDGSLGCSGSLTRAPSGVVRRIRQLRARRLSVHRRAHPDHPVAPAREFRKTVWWPARAVARPVVMRSRWPALARDDASAPLRRWSLGLPAERCAAEAADSIQAALDDPSPMVRERAQELVNSWDSPRRRLATPRRTQGRRTRDEPPPEDHQPLLDATHR
jgi:hypothetical protein